MRTQSLEEQFRDVYSSFVNGQGRQMVDQFDELDCYEKADFLDSIWMSGDNLTREFMIRYYRVKGSQS